MNRQTCSAQIIDLTARRNGQRLGNSLAELDLAMARQAQAVAAFRATMHQLEEEIGQVGRLWREYQAEANHLDVAPLRREADRLAEIVGH